MKGTMKVPKLNKSGLFISELDWDDTYKEKENPKGNFVMVIEPLEGFDEDVIYYEKLEDGFLIEGEAYILTGNRDILERKISKWKREYNQNPFQFIESKLH